MIYVDTSLVISYVDLNDPNHIIAEKIIEKVKSEKLVVGALVLVELASVYSRAGLERPLELTLYSLELIKAEVIDIDFNDVLKQAFKLASTLKLRTLDLLHIISCSLIKAKKFATLDQDIVKRLGIVSKVLGIEVLHR